MDPLRKPTEELVAANLLERVKALEEQMQAKNTPRQPEPKAATTAATHGHDVEVEVHLGPESKDEPAAEHRRRRT